MRRIHRLIAALILCIGLLASLAVLVGTDDALAGQPSPADLTDPRIQRIDLEPDGPSLPSDLLPRPTPAVPLPPLAAPRPPTLLLPADLTILYISRTPRYPRYCLDYTSGVPQLCGGTAGEKRFSDPGEPVTFTAAVANQGDALSATIPFTWTVDGVPHGGGLLPALAAGEEVPLSLNWPWQSGSHTVSLQLEGLRGELTDANNRLEHRTDAHYLEVLVHPLFVEAFAHYENLIGSYSFADWIQAQFARMNEQMAAAVYPETPAGIPDRVRVDVIIETTGVGGDIVVSTLDYDGRWTFRPAQDDHHTEEDEARESAYRYAEQFASGYDWGLIHELTHQLGAIDLYQLDVSPSVGNPLRDREGLPLLSGFYPTHPGLMGGDDTSPYHGGTFYSQHTAMALSRNTGYRRGYFGEYLYDLPDQIWLQVLDRPGQGVPGATVEVYQTERNVVVEQPVLTGVTDDAGHFLLPDRSVSPTVTTETGHSLRPNPYGAISVIGDNGQLLIRVVRDDQEFFAWLPITAMNKALWRGGETVMVTLPTHFPPATQVASPSGLAAPSAFSVRTAGESAQLQWELADGAVSYNIYRGLWPVYYPFAKIASGINQTAFSTAITTSSRFAVTAVGPDGTETGFGSLARAELLYAPRGLVWDTTPNDLSERGRLFVVDGHPGKLYLLLPPDCPPDSPCPPRWVGRVGSEHVGFVGATAAVLSDDGMLGVSVGGSQRIWVLDGRQGLVTWFGREGDYPSVLDHPAALLLAGEPFTVALPVARPDGAASLLLPFDGDLADPDGTPPEHASGVTFVDGRFGQAVAMEEGAALHYPASGHFDPEVGSVELWLRPDWSGASPQQYVFLEVTDGGEAAGGEGETAGYLMRMAYESGYAYIWVTDFVSHEVSAWAEVRDWQPDEWHHLAATWDEHRLMLYVDGRLQGSTGYRHPITGTATTIALGGTASGQFAADAALDEVRISLKPRLGNSDRSRVIVAEDRLAQVAVFDLMGNLVSLYAPSEGAAGALVAPVAMALGSNATVWLADDEARRVDQLRFDGDALHWTRSLSVTWTAGPRALAFHPDGLLAVADGDRVVLVDPSGDTVLAVWQAPNDGSPGPFRRPLSLAFGPDDDLAVAEDGNRRVTFIHRPLLAQRLRLPLVLRGG